MSFIKKNEESRFLEKIIFNILYNLIDLPIMFWKLTIHILGQ
jgi:hypothetical protein